MKTKKKERNGHGSSWNSVGKKWMKIETSKKQRVHEACHKRHAKEDRNEFSK